MKMVCKYTEGFVVQRWEMDTGRFLGQSFIAGTNSTYEDEEGNSIEETDFNYEPFDMIQPPGV